MQYTQNLLYVRALSDTLSHSATVSVFSSTHVSHILHSHSCMHVMTTGFTEELSIGTSHSCVTALKFSDNNVRHCFGDKVNTHVSTC